MTKRAIWGTALAVVFVLSMIMVPAFAGGHVILVDAEAKTIKGKSTVEATTTLSFEDGIGNFGLGAIGNSGRVIAVVTHTGIGLDSEALTSDSDSTFHTHVVKGKFVAACIFGNNVDGFAIASASFKEKADIELDGTDIEIKNIRGVGKLTGDVFAFVIRDTAGELCLDVKSTN